MTHPGLSLILINLFQALTSGQVVSPDVGLGLREARENRLKLYNTVDALDFECTPGPDQVFFTHSTDEVESVSFSVTYFLQVVEC